MNYRTVYSDELYHHGIKGMKWGVRKQPEKAGTFRTRKSLSTAKKVAMGLAVAAAVGGVSYYAIKTHRYNKVAHATVQRILNRKSTSNFIRNTSNNIWDFDGSYRSNPYSLRPGRGSKGKYYNGNSTFHYFSNNGKISSNSHLTGHSGRLTRAGASYYRQSFYSKKAAKTPITSDYFTNSNTKRRVLERKAHEALTEFDNAARASIARGNGVPQRYKTTNIPRLKRQRGPRILRVRG